MHYMYIIKSKKEEWYYVGISANMQSRIELHNKGQVRSTKSRKPYSLFYYEKFELKHDARIRELEIKNNWQLKMELINKVKLNNGPIV